MKYLKKFEDYTIDHFLDNFLHIDINDTPEGFECVGLNKDFCYFKNNAADVRVNIFRDKRIELKINVEYTGKYKGEFHWSTWYFKDVNEFDINKLL